VKILDFGLAKLTGTSDGTQSQTEVPTRKVNTGSGTVMGTMGYMSPEQLKGQPVDHRSDIFSFGAILYEMLSGKRAFRGNSMAETMSAILREDPPDLSEKNKTVSPALERVVRHCLEKNPAERFHSARDLAFAIESLSGSATISGQTATMTAIAATESAAVGLSRWFSYIREIKSRACAPTMKRRVRPRFVAVRTTRRMTSTCSSGTLLDKSIDALVIEDFSSFQVPIVGGSDEISINQHRRDNVLILFAPLIKRPKSTEQFGLTVRVAAQAVLSL
jgi:serine/threonine protein kinase